MRGFERVGQLMLVALLAGGCASGGNEANRSRFDRSVGTGSAVDIAERTMKVIRQYQFEIERESAEPNIYYETRWRNRTPFPDEQALGVTAAEIRMIVRGSPRSATPQGQIFAVDLTVETRVRTSDGSWSEAVATPQYLQYASKIHEDLRRELDIGVRRFHTND